MKKIEKTKPNGATKRPSEIPTAFLLVGVDGFEPPTLCL